MIFSDHIVQTLSPKYGRRSALEKDPDNGNRDIAHDRLRL